MAKKQHNWVQGARLEEHSRRKHKILREYIFNYLTVRCSLPQQRRFRLAIVDGFAGAGRYECGADGSPLIFMQGLKRAVDEVNKWRRVQGLGMIEVECLLIFNDQDHNAIELLKKNVVPEQVNITHTCSNLHIRLEYLNEVFEDAYPKIKALLKQGRYKNVLFNLDQYGDIHVKRRTICDIMRSYPSVEIFYTFVIGALLAFLQQNEPEQLKARLNHLGVTSADIGALGGLMSKNDWLGTAENIVFDTFRLCAPYVSPFSINNPGGWRYWLIHFANVYRARQVYNKILHENASLQAHFGRSGLNMLSYDPRHENGMLYLFDDEGRDAAKNQLLSDIPRLLTESGDAMPVKEFYESIYNITPAHTDDIHAAIIDNPDLEIITPAGGERRKANTISVDDTITLKRQASFFPMFLQAGVKARKVKKK